MSSQSQKMDSRFSHSSNIDLSTKIAMIFFNKRNHTKLFEVLVVFIEYFQLLSQIVLVASENITKKAYENNSSLLANTVVFICHLSNPFYSMGPNDKNSSLLTPLFYIAISYIVLKHALFAYIVGVIHYKLPASDFLVNAWRWIFQIQGRVLYYIFSSFWAQTIKQAWKDDIDIYSLDTRAVIIVVGTIMIIIEYINSLYPLIRWRYILPTKSFFAEKDNKTQIITLTQKFGLQLLKIFLASDLQINAWIFSVVGLMMDLTRNIHHFRVLPVYNMKALFYQGALLMIVTSFNLSWIFQLMLESSLEENNDLFAWMTWAILSFFTIKSSIIYQKKVMFNISTDSKNYPPQILIHKLYIINQIQKMAKKPNEYADKYAFLYLISKTLEIRIDTIMSTGAKSPENRSANIRSKNSTWRTFIFYLEELNRKFPKTSAIKLHLAYFYVKKLKLYEGAIRLIQELEKTGDQVVTLNVSLLKLDIQNRLSSRNEDLPQKINLSLYIKSQESFAKVKEKILKKSELQMKIYQNLLSDSPVLAEIFNISQEANFYQNEIEKSIVQMFESIPDYFIEPIAFLTHYYLLINHSPGDAFNYYKIFFKKYEKYKKAFTRDSLKEENAYLTSNGFMLVSGQKNEVGKILFCSKSTEPIYGKDSQFLLGKNFAMLSTPALQSWNLQKLKNQIELEGISKSNLVLHDLGHHHEGYMVELEYYISIYPFLNQGFCFAVIVRQVKTAHDCLLINENGDIEGATKNIRDKIGLAAYEQISILNISFLSKELSQINKVLNQIVSENNEQGDRNVIPNLILKENGPNSARESEQHENTNEIEKIKELCSIYMNEGKESVIKSLVNNNTYSFHCKVIDMFPEIQRRVIVLESVNNNNEGQIFENLSLDVDEHLSLKDSQIVRSEIQNRYESKDPQKLAKIFAVNSTTFPEKLNANRNHIGLSTFVSDKIYTEGSNLLSPSNSRFEISTLPKPLGGLPLQKTFQHFNHKKEKDASESHKKLEEIERSGTSNPLSSISRQLKLSKAFKTALAIKSYPKSSIILCIVFYVILAGVYSIQIYIKATWEDNLMALKVKKDILNSAFLRLYYLVDLPTYASVLVGLDNKKIDYTPIDAPPEYFYERIDFETAMLEETNAILLSNTNSLSEELRSNLFNKDVKVFELCSDCSERPYIKVDNFQATNMVLENILRLAGLMKGGPSQMIKEINLFSENCLNDLALKNIEITEIFLASLDKQREDVLAFTYIYLAISLTLIVLNTTFMSLYIWRQYTTEKLYLSNLSKLNTSGIDYILRNLKLFKESLDNQESFERTLTSNFNPLNFMSNDVYAGAKNKKQLSKKVNIRGLIKKYLFHIMKLGILMVIISGLCFWSAHEVQTFLGNLYKKQAQLYLINIIRARTGSIGHAVTDFIAMGNNIKIENLDVLPFIYKSINQVIGLKARIPQVFPPGTLQKGSDIEQLLYGDGCKVISSDYEFFCILMNDHGVLPNFIQTLISFEEDLISYYQQFSKLTEAELVDFSPDMIAYNVYISKYVLISEPLPNVLIEKIDKEYEAMLEGSITQRNLIFVIFSSCLGLLTIFIWISTLNSLKEANNRFKKVLKLFPPYLVLSNFVLKLFLLRNSKMALDFIKAGV